MNCSEVENSFTDIARGIDANPAMRKHAMLHARSCPQCARILESEQGLSDLLDALKVDMQVEAASSASETALLAEFRRRQDVVQQPLAAVAQRSYLSRWMLVAAAILLVFALGLLALRTGRNAPSAPDSGLAAGEDNGPAGHDRQEEKVRPEQYKPEEKQLAADKDSGTQPRNKHPRRPYSAVSKKNPVVNQEPVRTEIATEFFPMGGFGDLSDIDGGQVLRVKLPRSALVSFGLPVDPDREDQRVTADVLVGNDGVARAIRFVR
jgi:hypothetical protein